MQRLSPALPLDVDELDRYLLELLVPKVTSTLSLLYHDNISSWLWRWWLSQWWGTTSNTRTRGTTRSTNLGTARVHASTSEVINPDVHRSIVVGDDDDQWWRWDNDFGQFLACRLLQIVTLLQTNGNTPARKVLGLEMIPTTTTTSMVQQLQRRKPMIPNISNNTSRLLAYCSVRILLPAFYRSVKERYIRRQPRDTEPDQNNHTSLLSEMELVGRRRQAAIAKFLIITIDTCAPILRLATLLAYWSGKLSTPDLAMVLTGWTYKHIHAKNKERIPTVTEYESIAPPLHVDYTHRRWLQDECLTTIRVVWAGLPLIRLWYPVLDDFIYQPVARLLIRLRTKLQPRRVQQQATDSSTATCPACRARPITVPFLTSCGHIYCYTCLYLRSLKSRPVRCNVCDQVIQTSKPLHL